MPRLNVKNNAKTTLSAGIDSTVTSFSVVDGSLLPTAPFRITVGNEIMEVAEKVGNTLSSITRGIEGTTATAHEAGVSVDVRFTAGIYDELETSAGAQSKVDALAGVGNTKTVKQLADEAATHLADDTAHGINTTISTALVSPIANIKILTRDILRVKMRQTGLNLDPNAWSDTLEDATGINAVVSSGYMHDNINKSLKCDSGWTATGTATANVAGGILSFSASGAGVLKGYTKNGITIDAAKTKKVEIRAKCISGEAIVVRIVDGTKRADALFYADGSVKYNNSDGIAVNLATGQPLTSYFTAVITFDNTNGMNITINGDSIGTVPYANLYAHAVNYLQFGCNFGGSAAAASGEVDYLKYTLDTSLYSGAYTYTYSADALPTEAASSATVIWNTQTSDGMLTNVIIEAIESLGTGTLDYYISRDGGTTYTACTLDTITSIAAQPAGTSIVVKVEITGNAELLALAFGGQV